MVDGRHKHRQGLPVNLFEEGKKKGEENRTSTQGGRCWRFGVVLVKRSQAPWVGGSKVVVVVYLV
jgi:hypothetical protein